ncbi:thyroid hormone receptor beta-A [Lingula anatina]|uniref:Thyroid hormone receptor beta-A n=1 Tax=Lingula anatina TaxID=7574 RepID=A0A1S3J8I4_LINAN|nr:thyroid hormone receptor beta-A [Lingula anatina]|eukprot:XP_013406710.1 thyroid hormone receptor beta-A [Lingula anatina]
MNLPLPPNLYSPRSDGQHMMAGYSPPYGDPPRKKPKVGNDSMKIYLEPPCPDSSRNPQQNRPSAGTPYIPSYMDLTNGPEPCVVCSDAATGYHYRCMTCEGCKGFFRRTIQKNLKYHCKWNNNCIIDKTTRNQCQECRFRKCLTVGMATDLVLNEKQRVAKRKLIEENRERRRMEQMRLKLKQEHCMHDSMTEDDKMLVQDIVAAYEQTSVNVTKNYTIPRCEDEEKLDRTNPEVWQQLAEIMTPSIVKVVEFAKQVPGFVNLNVDDQILLLKSCCMEIMCLRAACRYNPDDQTLTLQSGLTLNKAQMRGGGFGLLVEPIFEFAMSLAKLKLDKTEIALLAAVLLMQSDRTGLKEPESVEKLQDAVLGAYKRYIAERRPDQPVHWAKILMKVTDLRTISTRHAERVLCIKLDCPGEIPPLFLEMFDEGEQQNNDRRQAMELLKTEQSNLVNHMLPPPPMRHDPGSYTVQMPDQNPFHPQSKPDRMYASPPPKSEDLYINSCQ